MELERSNQYIYKILFRKNRDAALVSNTSTQESEALGFPWVQGQPRYVVSSKSVWKK